MQALIEGGRIVDLILLLMAGEAAVLAWLRARHRIGVGLRAMLPNLLAGAFLLLALRAALTAAGYPSVAAWLLLGLLAHLADLFVRSRSTSSRGR
ncbi:MAG: hypothetical protein ACR2I8_08460 [Steroidobacteraceae bacterium]